MGERPDQVGGPATAPEEPADRASANDTGAGLETAAAEDPDQIRIQIEQTRDEMSETIDAIQERLNPRNLVAQAKDSVREATVGKVKEMAHNVSDTASGMADSTMEAAGDLAGRVKDNPWPAVAAGLGAAWFLLRNGNGSSRRYPAGYASAPATNRYRGAQDGGMIEVLRSNPVPTALAGLGLGMLAMKGREASRTAASAARASSWRRPTDQGTSYDSTNRARRAGDQAGESLGRAKQAVSDAAGHAQEVASESFEAAQQRVSQLSTQARDYSEELLDRNPLLLGAAALLAGAAIGLSLPETEPENQFMGSARETLVERAQEAAHAAVEKVKDVAGEAAQNLGQ